jgi:hypothetical protein
MSKSPQDFTTSQIHLAYTAITSINSDDELSATLQLQGFSRSMIDQGEAVYNAATEAISSEIIAKEELDANVKKSDEQQMKIRKLYAQFAATASECFGRDALEMLGLRSGKPRSNKAYCESLKSSVAKLNRCPELSKRMQAKGFDMDCIKHASELTATYETIVEQQVKLEKNLENAVKKRNTAMFTLRNWLSSFAEAVLIASESRPYILKQLGMEKRDLCEAAHIDIRKVVRELKVH